MSIKLYKFRPLVDKCDFCKAKDILERGFWCSKFSELNDPMEGVFSISRSNATPRLIERIYSEKCRYKICSFSLVEAFKNPSMWGYYASGFKGIAIEIRVDRQKVKVEEITYAKDIADINNASRIDEVDIKRILTTKLDSWEHEKEYRFLQDVSKEPNSNPCEIGKITAVYFGNPYGKTINASMIHNSNPEISNYKRLRKDLIKVAYDKGIECYSIDICGNKVVKGEKVSMAYE
jgi:hypothetical protein